MDQSDPSVRLKIPTEAETTLLLALREPLCQEISSILDGWGYKFEVVHDAGELPAVVERTSPDLLLLDDALVQTQWEKFDHIFAKLPVILLCGHENADCRARAFSSGCADVAFLPVGADELRIRISNQLRLRDWQQSLHQQAAEFEALNKARQESERQFRLMADNVDEIFFIASEDSREFYYINPAFEVITGVPAEKLYRDPSAWQAFITSCQPYRGDTAGEEWEALTADLQRRELEITRRDGTKRWIWLQRKPVYNEQDELIFQVGTATDITDRKKAEKAMLEAQAVAEARAAELQAAIHREQRLNEITRAISSRLDLQGILIPVVNLSVELLGADAGSLGILSADRNQLDVLYYLNFPENVRRITTFTRSQGGMMWQVMDTLKPIIIDDYQQLPNAIPALVEAGVHAMLGVPIQMGDTCLGTLAIHNFDPVKKFTLRDLSLAESIGRQAGVAITNARLFEQVQQLAITDSLTQIHNRRYFFEQAHKEVIRLYRYGGSLSMIMMDIDHFKIINDQYAHQVGDQVLRQLAELCRKGLRSVDYIARYGGEEFIFLLPETGIEEAARTARRLCAQIADKVFSIDNHDINLTVSMGVTALTSLGSPKPAENVDEVVDRLVNEADRAMYLAKASGRNQVAVWHETIEG